MKFARIAVIVLLGSILWAADKNGEWSVFGGDPGSTKYSRLSQINKANVKQLQPIWQWKTGEKSLPQYKTVPTRFEVTPLMIDGAIYPFHTLQSNGGVGCNLRKGNLELRSASLWVGTKSNQREFRAASRNCHLVGRQVAQGLSAHAWAPDRDRCTDGTAHPSFRQRRRGGPD